jgi:disulfide bond formation protein DsbB
MFASSPAAARGVLAAVAVAAALALGVAFLLQFGFKVAPCNLCIWERYPYAFVILAAVGGLWLGRPRPALALAALALLGNAGLSFYHVGVEEGWFALPGGCIAGTGAQTVEQLRAQLMAAAPTCDQVKVIWMGLSLAAWNGITALGLGLAALAGALGRWPRGRDEFSGAAATPLRSGRGS